MKSSMRETVMNAIADEWEAFLQLAPRIALALVVLLLAYVLGKLVGRGVAKLLRRGNFTPTHQSFFRTLAFWVVLLIGFAASLNVLGLGGLAGGLLAGGGLLAVVLGFAFREIGENLLAGFFLAFSRPFDVGDIIESGSFLGAVRAIDLRTTHIRANDGRDVFIPNAQIFNSPLTNYTLDGLRRPSFKLGIDYGDDVEKAVKLLVEAAASISPVLADPAPSVRIDELAASYVVLEVAFWVDLKDQTVRVPAIRTAVMDACRKALRRASYTLSNDCSTVVAMGTPTGIDVRMAS